MQHVRFENPLSVSNDRAEVPGDNTYGKDDNVNIEHLDTTQYQDQLSGGTAPNDTKLDPEQEYQNHDTYAEREDIQPPFQNPLYAVRTSDSGDLGDGRSNQFSRYPSEYVDPSEVQASMERDVGGLEQGECVDGTSNNAKVSDIDNSDTVRDTVYDSGDIGSSC